MRIYISLTAASTEEILRGTFYNHNIHASTSEVGQMLKKVDLATHGYRREVTTKLVEGPSGSQRHYHQVNCNVNIRTLTSMKLERILEDLNGVSMLENRR